MKKRDIGVAATAAIIGTGIGLSIPNKEMEETVEYVIKKWEAQKQIDVSPRYYIEAESKEAFAKTIAVLQQENVTLSRRLHEIAKSVSEDREKKLKRGIRGAAEEIQRLTKELEICRKSQP